MFLKIAPNMTVHLFIHIYIYNTFFCIQEKRKICRFPLQADVYAKIYANFLCKNYAI